MMTGQDLKELRQKAKLTQAKLGELIGARGRHTISAWEIGQRGISPMMDRLIISACRAWMWGEPMPWE